MKTFTSQVKTLCALLVLWTAAGALGGEIATLWNKMGSQAELLNSEIGPDGCYGGGHFSFVPGMFGGALSANYANDWPFGFPSGVVPAYAGCIEFWAKLTGFPAEMGCGSYGTFPVFVQAQDETGTCYTVHLVSNDGASNGGLCGRAGRTFNTGSGYYGSWTYSQVLGAGQEESWHHYALVWDANGIAGVGNGTKKVAVFLDGELESGRWQDSPSGGFAPLAWGSLNLIGIHGGYQGTVAMDNIKIWDYANIDFSHRFEENWIPKPGSLALMLLGALLLRRRS